MKATIILFVALFFLSSGFAQQKPVPIPPMITGDEVVSSNTRQIINPSSVSFNFAPIHYSNASISYHPTGVYTIYDLQSNGVPQQIWQDPLIPMNVHTAVMWSITPGFSPRRCTYLFSQDGGNEWLNLGDVPAGVQSGFPAITGFSDGRVVIANHNNANGTSTRTKIYVDLFPGISVFTEYDAGSVTNGEPIWPYLVPKQNGITFISALNLPGFSFGSFTNTLNLPSGIFSGYSSYMGDIANGYALAIANNGNIGHAYIGNEVSNQFDAFFRESTDGGLNWSTPLRIWDWNPIGDSIGVLRGINIVYLENIPFIAFNTMPLNENEFFPWLPSQIRVWSPSVNGGVPVVIADHNNIPFYPNTGNTGDLHTPICRPSIGKSSSGANLFVTFVSTTQHVGLDSSRYFAGWLAASTNGGASWDNPFKITPDSPLRDWRFLSISPTNHISGNQVVAQIMAQSDSVAGTHVVGAPIGMAQFIGIKVAYSTIPAPPSAPILVNPANNSTGVPVTPTFTWNGVPTASSYRLQVSTNSSFTNLVIDQNLTSTQYTPSTPLNILTNYFWRVNATNNIGTSPYSSTWSFTTSANTPSAPNLISPVNGATNISLTPTLFWSSVSNSTGYRVQVSTNNTFSNVIVEQNNLTSTQYAIPSSILQNGTTYYWRALAFNQNGEGPWSAVWNFITVSNIPQTPVHIAPPNFATGVSLTPTIQWQVVSNATSYRLQVSLNTGFTNLVIDQTALTSNSYIVPSGVLSPTTIYYWRVMASNQFGNSPWSAYWRFTTVNVTLTAPELVFPPNASTNISITPTMTWNTVQYATRYRMQVATDLNFNNMIFDESNITDTFKLVPSPILTLNNLYFWRVQASNLSSTGPWSSVWNFRTSTSNIFNISTEIPEVYMLYNNYPNPFNPTTNIKFDLPENTILSLIVYDINGREVKRLVDNKTYAAGKYLAEFNAQDLSSGVYFYSLRTDKFFQTKKLVVVK
jgi:hypothetical protein